MQIEVNGLTYIYSEKSKSLAVRAIDNVSVTINEGEFFGIIGCTGSGKSTFVQHLNALIKVEKNKGSIVIGDYNLADKKCDFKSLRAKVGMVFQYPEYQLFAETVKEDVAFGIKNFFPNVNEAETEKMVEDALNIVGLDYLEIKDKSPFDLSGGQKRRVAIAGVLVTRPEVLVLDEPAAGLDPVGKREFINLLHSVHSTFAKTIIIVSHDMDLVAENCTGVAVFNGGKIVKTGTPKQIFASGEDIANLGLDLPLTAYLTDKLSKSGINIENDLTANGFIEAVAKEFGGKKQ